jgi:signal transduction histidine kinase
VAEALTNVVKHARAGRATVEITLDEPTSTLAVLVRDDGIGGAEATHGSGLVGMSDRIAAKNGTLAIDSRDGAGTTLSVTLPDVHRR